MAARASAQSACGSVDERGRQGVWMAPRSKVLAQGEGHAGGKWPRFLRCECRKKFVSFRFGAPPSGMEFMKAS